MLVTPLVRIQIFSKIMLVDWPKCGSDLETVTWHVCCNTLSVFRGVSIELDLFKNWKEVNTATALLLLYLGSGHAVKTMHGLSFIPGKRSGNEAS